MYDMDYVNVVLKTKAGYLQFYTIVTYEVGRAMHPYLFDPHIVVEDHIDEDILKVYVESLPKKSARAEDLPCKEEEVFDSEWLLPRDENGHAAKEILVSAS